MPVAVILVGHDGKVVFKRLWKSSRHSGACPDDRGHHLRYGVDDEGDRDNDGGDAAISAGTFSTERPWQSIFLHLRQTARKTLRFGR